MKKKFNIKEWQDSRTTIKEDGGTYETTIFLQDSGNEVYVEIKDSEGVKQHNSFSDIKGAYTWILEYMNQWDLE